MLGSRARKLRTAIVFAAICLWIAATLAAQEYRGTVTGVVTDVSQAVIPNVEVHLTNTATNVSFRTTSTTTGAYSFRLLEPGIYKLRAEAAGFKPLAVEAISVGTTQSVGLNLQLQVGDISQTVEVTAQAPLLNTQSGDSGQTIDKSRIEDLPMLGRSPFALARISPGVITVGMLNETKPYDVGGQSFVSIGGGRRYNTEFAINGVPNILPVGYFSGRVAYTPPADATEEFRVITNAFDAQYGHTGGGVITVTTKSGTNQFHGSLYEFLQNDKFNATNFFVNSAGGTKPPRRYNQFGGSIGGPLVIPKVFNGKDRMFFFFSYEGIRNAAPGASYATVPTGEMRSGDLSALASRKTTLYDPATAAKDASGNWMRLPFAGNRISADRISPIARNILAAVPPPNLPGADLENNYFSSSGSSDIYNNFLGRLDYNISQKQRLFFSIGQYTTNNLLSDLFKTIATGSRQQGPKQIISFADTYTVSPSFLLDVRLGYTGYSGNNVPKNIGFDVASLGFPKSLASQMVEAAFPRIEMTYFTGFGTGNRATHATTQAHTYFASAAATKIHGAHNTRFGFEGREKQDNEWDRLNTAGFYTFNGQYTAGPGLSAGPGFGHDFATFLLGLPSTGQIDVQAPASMRGRYYAVWVQDDWKITPSLTLNLGLRYDMESAAFERHNRVLAGWLWGESNPIEKQAVANYALAPDAVMPVSQFKVQGGVRFAGENGTPSSVWDRDWERIQPRLSLAWNPAILNRRLSFRAGAGITNYSLAPPGTGYWQYGFSQTTQFTPSLDNGATFVATLQNPFPNGIDQPVGSSLGPLTYLGLANIALTRKQLPPRYNHYTASIQYQFTRTDVLEVNYSGSVLVHTPGTNYPVNYIPVEYMGKAVTRDTTAINFLSAPVKNPFQGLVPVSTPLGKATIPRMQLLMTYPEFGAVGRAGDNSGSITNQAVYFAWERRMSKGLNVLANYMISKQLWARDKKNPQDTMFERRVGSEDRPQQFTMSASYELPFGRKKAFLAGQGGIGDRIVSGWQIGGIYFAQSGAALTWGALIYTGASYGELNNVPGGRSINQWFNTTVFNKNAGDQPNTTYQLRYSPLAVGPARAPGVNSLDMSFSKRTPIRERLDLQFRADFFDFLNHPNWGSPNVTPTSAAFGKITGQANLPRTAQLGLRLTF